ncbi:nuclear pore complex subunit [Scheffersomyces xylosifermentans]|uniref:nuclear pore complex subunit n=1 Tax=Scheffersomyces xylosifermentans TaxID=1304137 RepID=UPI00315CB1DA
MSLDSIIDGFKGSKKSELTIENLIISSDYFLKKAHEQVLRTNNSNGRDIYFKLIKLSIQALLMIVKNYANVLTPYVEVIVFFKLASIYISETENIEKADEYVNRAIAISKRNKFAEALFLSEFLEAQIIEKSSPHLLINYLNEKITNYEESHFQNFANAFSLVKIDTLLTRDPDTSVILLQNLIQGSLDPLTHSYCLLHLSNLHLYRGSPAVAMELIEEADRLIDISGNVPVQLKAMSSLTRYYAYIESNEVDLSTKLMKSISSLMSSEQKVSWKTWREDGIFKLDLPMNDGNNMSYKVFWLNSDEFVIMFYFLTGVHFMCEAANGKKKSKKVFDKCLQIIEKQLAELENFSEEDRELNIVALSDRLVKLKFTKYCIKCYQAWIGFLNNDWKAINYLNEFMSSYNNRKFTNREFVYFSLLLPKVFYLFALYYHEKGDLQAAKYYYLKVRNLTSGTNSINSKVPPCSNIGIGSAIIAPKQEFSELFAFSTLHLFILSLFELKEAAKVPAERRNEILSGCHKLSNQLYKDLNEAFITKSTSNSFSQGFASSNDLLRMTYKVHAELSKDISSGDNSPNVIAEISECYEKYENSTFFPFIGNLVKYLLFTMTTDIAQKNAYFEKCLSVVSTPNGSDFDKIVSVFILKSLIHHFRRSGENERANMAELQLQYFQKCLSEKFKFVSENVHL